MVTGIETLPIFFSTKSVFRSTAVYMMEDQMSPAHSELSLFHPPCHSPHHVLRIRMLQSCHHTGHPQRCSTQTFTPTSPSRHDWCNSLRAVINPLVEPWSLLTTSKQHFFWFGSPLLLMVARWQLRKTNPRANNASNSTKMLPAPCVNLTDTRAHREQGPL